MGHVGSEQVSYHFSSYETTPSKTDYSTSTPIVPHKQGDTSRNIPKTLRSLNFSATSFVAGSNLTPMDLPDCSEFFPEAKLERDLSDKREMVELLDCEPILDYLVRNGAINVEEAMRLSENINGEYGAVDLNPESRNKDLLRIIECRPQARPLFVNAMRLTGQHFLANMADDGIRIKALSGSGYLSRSRHKGQIELYVRVKSVKYINDVKFLAVSQLLHKNFISLEDIQSSLSSVRRLEVQRNASLRLGAALDENVIDKKQNQVGKNSKKRCCICCCVVGNKGKMDAEIPLTNLANNSAKDSVVIVYQPASINGLVTKTNAVYNGGEYDGSVEDLKEVSHTIQAFCKELYDQFVESQSELHSYLVRYFEQDRGVLLLEVSSPNNKLHLKFICTKADQVQSVEQDISSGTLNSDLERLVCQWLKENERNEESLTLHLQIDEDSLEKSKQELQS